MNIEKYLENLVLKYENSNQGLNEAIIKEIKKKIFKLEKKKIHQIELFGSSIKKTSIRELPKEKLLISIKERDSRSLEEIIIWFYNSLTSNDFKVKKIDNDLELKYKGIDFILVFAKKKDKTFNYYLIKKRELDKEVLTNFNLHTSNVINSKFQKEIILMKLWRDKHNLDFPTMYLELVVLEVLNKSKKKNLFSRIIRVLDFLRKDFISEKFYDPSNTHNIISKYLSFEDKLKIQNVAKFSLTEEYSTDIIN